MEGSRWDNLSHLFCRNVAFLTVTHCQDLGVGQEMTKLWYLYLKLNWMHTKVVSSNPVHGEVYSIQHYVIKFVSDLRQVDGFLRILRFPPPIKLTVTI